MKKVLFGGAFDLLHSGHLLAIKKAKSYGDYLIVNVMSDERCRFKKGEGRPIIPAKERVEMVKALRDVDEVNCLYGDPDFPTLKLAEKLRPDVLVIDAIDHPHEPELEKRCKELGIQFVQLDRIVTESGLDTTKIIKKITDETLRNNP
jgi:cytidyltransferase-like protein